MEGGGAPLAAHMREKGSPGFTTRSLKEDTMRGVPSEKAATERKQEDINREREVLTEMQKAEQLGKTMVSRICTYLLAIHVPSSRIMEKS